MDFNGARSATRTRLADMLRRRLRGEGSERWPQLLPSRLAAVEDWSSLPLIEWAQQDPNISDSNGIDLHRSTQPALPSAITPRPREHRLQVAQS